MNQEIERKYLLADDSWRNLVTGVQHIRQGYLSLDPDRTIRVRRKDNQAFITIKGRNREGGISHFEWEHEISLADAEALFPLCLNPIIDKHRHLVPWQNFTIEIDVFHADNEGLVLAEIELPSENTPVSLPPFITSEVTDDSRYQNSNLSVHPYTSWGLEPDN